MLLINIYLGGYVIMKRILLGMIILMASSSMVMAENINESRLEQNFQKVLITEKKTREEFRFQKKKLEEELSDLERIMANKSKMMKKLEKDSEIRWHRDKYKILLKEYKHYYVVLENKIKETKEQINELSKLIKAM